MLAACVHGRRKDCKLKEAIMGEDKTPRIVARLFTRPNPAPNRTKRVLCVVVSVNVVLCAVRFGDGTPIPLQFGSVFPRTDTMYMYMCMYLVMYRYVF